jgi:two-component system, OmpR family, response regulator
LAIKILIADDEPHIRKVLELKLKGAGFEVRAATNGAKAFENAKEFFPALIITDYKMPGEMNGVDLIRAVRDTEGIADTPIILLTGSVAVLQTLGAELESVPKLTLMSKPFSPRQLIKVVTNIIKTEPTEETESDA